MPVTQHHAGQRLDLKVVHGIALLLREVAHLCLRELDVIQVALGHLCDSAFDLLRRQAKIRG